MSDRQKRAPLAAEYVEKIRAKRLLVPDCITTMIKSSSATADKKKGGKDVACGTVC